MMKGDLSVGRGVLRLIKITRPESSERQRGLYCKKASLRQERNMSVPLRRMRHVPGWHDVRQIPKIVDEMG